MKNMKKFGVSEKKKSLESLERRKAWSLWKN
jgi:hypothetical protein